MGTIYQTGSGCGHGSYFSTMVRHIFCSNVFFFFYADSIQGTVVSIQENPYPRPAGPLPEEVRTVLGTVRRNIRFIFSGVSSQHSATSESESLVTIRVRGLNSSVAPDQSIKQEDSPSLLFYYIFDDWFSSYSLVAKREHKYGVSLDQLVRIP